MGRFGNVMLVNGEPRYRADGRARRGRALLPHERLQHAHVQPVVPRRAHEGRRRATSGNYEREEWVESVVIAPAERYVVHVRFDRPGHVALVNRVRGARPPVRAVLPRGGHARRRAGRRRRGRPRPRAVVRDAARRHRDVSASIARYRALARRARRTRRSCSRCETRGPAVLHPAAHAARLDLLHAGRVERHDAEDELGLDGRQVRWILRDPATGRENMDIDWRFRRGDVVKVRLVNERRVVPRACSTRSTFTASAFSCWR